MNPSRPGAVCIFCLFHRDRVQPETCTYGLRHEYPEDGVAGAPPPPVQPKGPKVDKKLCIKCGLHPKNPKAVGCDHEFPP